MIDDDKRLRARDDELAEDCATIDKALDRKLRAELGVAEWERLMIAFFVPYDDAQTPEQETRWPKRKPR